MGYSPTVVTIPVCIPPPIRSVNNTEKDVFLCHIVTPCEHHLESPTEVAEHASHLDRLLV